VLAEYNGGPINAGYLRAKAPALAAETRSYVPRVLELHERLKQEFEAGPALALQTGAPSIRNRRRRLRRILQDPVRRGPSG
jgi:hypothetical protein